MRLKEGLDPKCQLSIPFMMPSDPLSYSSALLFYGHEIPLLNLNDKLSLSALWEGKVREPKTLSSVEVFQLSFSNGYCQQLLERWKKN